MKTISVKAYDSDIHLSIGDDAKKVVQYINRKFKESRVAEDNVEDIKRVILDANVSAFYLSLADLQGHGLIWLNTKFDEQDDFIVLSHEVIHACVSIFNRIGSNVNGETEENFCYLHDFLMKECLKEAKKVRNEHNIKTQKPVGVIQKLVKGDEPST